MSMKPEKNAEPQLDAKGNVRVGIKYLMHNPAEFGYAIIVPDIRPDAPTMPFEVEDSDLRGPHQPHATLKRAHNREMLTGDHGGQVVRNDLLLHVDTGMFAVCVARISNWDFRIEALLPPQTEEDMKRFLGTSPHGTGRWVVVGSAWTKNELELAKKRMGVAEPEVISPEDTPEARKQTSKHPDRKGWSEQGFKVGKDITSLSKAARNKQRASYAKFLAGIDQTVDAKDLDKDAERVFETKDKKGTVTFWNTQKRAMRKIKDGEPPAGG